jgi:hypothetical protein
MSIRKELHVQPNDETYRMPLVKYTLIRDEKKSLYELLKGVKFPNGYASNIGQCINKLPCKILIMKSHNYHVFLQCLLFVTIQTFSMLEIQTTLIEFSTFFR